jgi:two-component system phosphate regulon response regulator PhoB
LAKILVIENDISFLDLLRVHLASAGHEVVTAEDAALGLRAVIENVPDLIILDMFIPYLDGIEVLGALRTDPATAPIPVIVLTGTRDDEIYAKARNLGVADYLTKPVQRDRLLQVIDATLARKPVSS